MQIILASQSPRRQELMRQIGLSFTVLPAQHEALPNENLPFAEAVREIAVQKAQDVANYLGENGEDKLIIAADTMVCLKNELLGKPISEADAKNMLKRLSGETHTVYTAVVLYQNGKIHSDTVATDVTFRKLSDAEIVSYVSTGEPLDKAGAYGVQGLAAHFVSRIEGDFYNVVGLPLCRLWEMLDEINWKGGFS